MSEILETYQAEEELKETPETSALIATIVSVGQNGVGLRFDGSSADAAKNYPRNTGLVLAVGQRVVVQKINGEFVVMAPVGPVQDTNVVSKSDLGSYALKTDLDEYVKTSDLPAVPSFETTTNTTGGISLTAGSSTTATLTVTKAGFRPIGIVGVRSNQASNAQSIVAAQFYLSASNIGSGTITYGVRNAGSSTLSGVTYTFTVLWQSV